MPTSDNQSGRTELKLKEAFSHLLTVTEAESRKLGRGVSRAAPISGAAFRASVQHMYAAFRGAHGVPKTELFPRLPQAHFLFV